MYEPVPSALNALVVVDLSQTQFIDSSFLKNLKNAHHFDHVSTRDEALAWAPQIAGG